MTIPNDDFIPNDDYAGAEDRLGYEDARWSYTGMGFNFEDNQFRIGDETHKAIEIIPLAFRQFKVEKLADNKEIRYGKFDKRGKAKMQMVFVLPDNPTKLYCFGSGAYTARASFFNTPKGGGWHNEDFPVGIYTELLNHIKAVKAKTGKRYPFNAWQFTIKPSDEKITVTSARDKNMKKKVHVLVRTGFKYVGAELTAQLDEIYKAEDLDGWIMQYEENYEPKPIENATPQIDEFEEDDQIPF